MKAYDIGHIYIVGGHRWDLERTIIITSGYA
jgi:hypothetical protein